MAVLSEEIHEYGTTFDIWERFLFITTMHFSRMRTVRCSSRLLGGGGLPARWRWCVPRGRVCPGGSACKGGSAQGVSTHWVSAWGVSAQVGVCLEGVSQHALRQTPRLCTEWLTDRCKNITSPQTTFAGGENNQSIGRFIDQSLICRCYHHRFYSVSGSRCDGDGCSIAAGAALLGHLEPQQEAYSFYIFPEGEKLV